MGTSKQKINSILKLSIKSGIKEIDTANEYNKFQQNNFLKLKKFKIYQKINLSQTKVLDISKVYLIKN